MASEKHSKYTKKKDIEKKAVINDQATKNQVKQNGKVFCPTFKSSEKRSCMKLPCLEPKSSNNPFANFYSAIKIVLITDSQAQVRFKEQTSPLSDYTFVSLF